ncbi:DMT family transporter [Bowmanella yangjiangensis]|uniref:DMT family transporter n=1 Tax=Bowmanella yangjiangensis TaxID=2811230 RepID=A0ABS3D2E7_9ALTE|nr:DMT family transporter [Bowmanella yangjiangensis]MBN7822775.1 DMT family transporter [Bowmanella yangjiangensis]
MWVGALCALIAGMMWGLVFIGPLLLPDYPALLISIGRYLAYGLIALPLAWLDRAALLKLSRNDWLVAALLSAVGNFLYYFCLASSIQRTGGALSTMIIGTLPVVIAVAANLQRAAQATRLPWMKLLPSTALIIIGVICVNQAELGGRLGHEGFDQWSYGFGVLLAIAAVACWTWYPLRNADWLRENSSGSARTWATAQGIVTLPMAIIGLLCLWSFFAIQDGDFEMPLGPEPGYFILVIVVMALFSSWLATVCWNEASRRLPPALVGQLIVLETLAAMAYLFIWRGDVPGITTLSGMVVLIVGVLIALKKSRAL